MSNQCIVVADRGRARLFTVEEPEDPRFEAGPRLIEQRDLVNPQGTLTDEELFRDRRSGRKSRLAVTGGGYALEDRKERARQESARRFVKDLTTAISDLMRARELNELVLVASPKFLGLLRSEMRKSLRYRACRGFELACHPSH